MWSEKLTSKELMGIRACDFSILDIWEGTDGQLHDLFL